MADRTVNLTFKMERGITMETVSIYSFQLDFIKDLLREHQKSKHSDRDTRLMAKDILDTINAQHSDTVCEVSLLTGEVIEIKAE